MFQNSIKHFASLLVHSNFGTCTFDPTERTLSFNEKSKSRQYLGFHYPDQLILSPEQHKIIYEFINEDDNCLTVVTGDAGSGKTTILLILLIYYAGKQSTVNQEVIFVVPEEKWGFKSYLKSFVLEHCKEELVS